MGQRILVTGGAGFIGSHIVDQLVTQGYSVVVIDNESTGKRAYVNSSAKFIEGDVRNINDLALIFQDGFDAVMHLAGQASIKLSFSDPTTDLSINTQGTINLINACIKHRVPRFLFASSMTVYGNTDIVPTPESAPTNPASYYAVAKYAAERYVHLTAQRHDLDFDFNVTSLRMFNVYGARQSLGNAYQGVLAIFIGNILRGETIHIHGDGEQFRDFVYVDDVAQAWLRALENPATYGQVINLGTGNPTTVNRLCELVLKAFGYSKETYPVEYKSPQLGDVRSSAANIARAQSLLGWSPTIDLDFGLLRTIAWARTEAQLS